MPPIYINGQEVVKRYVGIQEVVAAYVGAQQVFSGAAPATGVFFDSASGDSFITQFTDPGDASLTVGALSAAFSSGTTKTVDFNLNDDAGNVMWHSLDHITIDATYTITSFPAADALGFHVGMVNSALGEYAMCIKAHPATNTIAFGFMYVSGSPTIADSSGYTIGGGITCRVVVDLSGSAMTATVSYAGTANRNFSRTLNYSPGTTELPRMFNKVGVRWKSGVSTLTAMKISAAFPNAKYAFVGDSITQGRFASAYSDAYPQQIRAVYPNDVIVAAAPSAKITDYIGKTYQVRAMKPKYAIIMLGVNDLGALRSPAQIRADMATLKAEISADGAIPIACSITPCNNFNAPTVNSNLASDFDHFIDVYNPLLGVGNALNAAYDTGDGVHLNTSGNTLVANTILAYITANGLT